jgi:Tol biopolymer transport system component
MVVRSPLRAGGSEQPTGLSDLEALREHALIEEARRRARMRRRGYALVALLGLGLAVLGRHGGGRPGVIRSGGPGGGVVLARPASVNGRIAISDRSATLMSVYSDGSGLQATVRCPLVAPSCGIFDPAWSPDGSTLAFVRGDLLSSAPDSLSLYLASAGGGMERLIAGCGYCGERYGSHLSWSPDGSRIAFSRDFPSAGKFVSTLIWIADTASGKVRQLTTCPLSSCTDLQPDWSPDGQLIAFRRLTSHGEYLYSIHPDGSRLIDLGTPAAADPQWSPDGSMLAFDGILGIYVSAADGSQSRLVAQGDDEEAPGVPSWSPDGTQLAFFSTPEEPAPPADPRAFGYGTEVWTVNADGTGKTPIARSGCCVAVWAAPVWSPDGKQIAFAANQSGGTLVVNNDGSELHPVSSTAATALDWQKLR